MDVATLQTVSNVGAYGELMDTEEDVAPQMGGTGGFMKGQFGGIHQSQMGITRLSSGMQELGLLNEQQIDLLNNITAIIGVGYGALLVFSAITALLKTEIAVKMAMAVAETAEALAIPVYGEIMLAAAIGGAALVYAAFSSEHVFGVGDMSSGTDRRLAASQLGGI
jgi:hypothetical protein